MKWLNTTQLYVGDATFVTVDHMTTNDGILSLLCVSKDCVSILLIVEWNDECLK